MEQRLRRYQSDLDLNSCGKFEGNRYVSQWCQGLHAGMEWLRLSLEGAQTSTVRIYASDRRDEDGPAPVMERRGGDLILYGVRGRFLRFTVEPAETLRGYTLSFPAQSIDVGLPFAMQGDETLRRYLGVYQSLYMDLNEEFAAFSGRLDPLGEDPVPGLERWTGAARWLRGAPAQARKRLIANAPLLNRMRGTWPGLRLFLKLAAGRDGELHEPFRWQERITDAAERAACARLYGQDGSRVTVLLPEGVSKELLRYLERAMEDFLPVGVRYDLVPLEAGAPMDGYSYLDSNAQLTEPPPSTLDGTSLENLILE